MKSILVLALCLGVACADFHSSHYDAHQEAIDTARRNAYGSSGYGASGSNSFGAGGTAELSLGGGVGGSSLGNLESSYDSVGAVEGVENSGNSLGGGSGFGSNNAASFGANIGAGFGASNQAAFGANNAASFGSNSAFSSNSAFQTSHSANFNAASSHNVGSNVEFADANNAGTEVNFGGANTNTVNSESLLASNMQAPVALTLPSSSGNNVEYLHHERVVSSAPQQIVYTVPGGSQQYVQHVERVVEQKQPSVQYVQVAQPSGTSESYYQRKVTTTSSTPQIVQQPSARYTYGSNTGSSFGSNAASTFGSNAASTFGTNSAFKVNQGFGTNFGSNFGQRSGAQTQWTSGQNSAVNFGSGSSQLHKLINQAQLTARQQAASDSVHSSGPCLASADGGSNGFNSGSSLNSASSLNAASGLNAGASGSLLSGSLLSGSLLGGASLNSQNNLGLNAGQQLSGSGNFGGAGGAGSGYQTKQWEKQSKWSSQSEFGSDGHVKNYKDLATGESENYNLNGKQFGYNAATASVDDNGRTSTYSVHS
ncbi:fibroin heavy chain-like [Drosophila nasuta]|uniref:fibroin heavy chain-like n=1 Tax=Drosophila nasuta TaxID=42062 RepID=UPI00295ED3A4|nr:fibroin heavy chain-like [Drosophila nasuta]